MAKTIVLKMTGNDNFPSPDPDLLTISSKAVACSNAYDAALNGSKQQKSELTQAETKLIAILDRVASYVDNIAAGNETIILSAGLQTQVDSTPAAVPDAPLLSKLVNNNVPLSLKASWNKVEFAKAYLIEQNNTETLEEDKWQLVAVQTQRTIIVAGLTSGSKYAFRVKALGIKGFGMYSNVLHCQYV